MSWEEPSRYMKRKFLSDFEEGLEFWTGENGEPVSFVVLCNDAGLEALKRQLDVYGEKFEQKRLRKKFAYRDRVASEDDYEHLRVIWRTGNDPTPFQVYEYQY